MAIVRLPSTGDAPRSTGVPESLVPGGSADSAGFAWEGRTFGHHDTAFAGDDGEAPAELVAAVAAVRAAARLYESPGGSVDTAQVTTAPAVNPPPKNSPPVDPSPTDRPTSTTDAEARLAEAHATVLVALSRSRLLVPLLAEAGDIGLTPEGKTVEKTQELSIVTVSAPDGRRVMPVFSSVATMRAWNPEARPIPVPGPQAAIAAAQEGTDLIIIDPGTPERTFGVRRTGLEAMALGTRVLPGWADPEVRAAFSASLAHLPEIRAVRVYLGDAQSTLLAPEIKVELTLAPGLSQAQLAALIDAAQRALAANDVVAARVDSMAVQIRSDVE